MLSMCTRCDIRCAALGQHLHAMRLQINIKHLSPLPAGRSCLLSQSGTHPNQSLHWFRTCSYSLFSQALRGAATLQRAALCSHNSFRMVWYVPAQSWLWNCCLIAQYQ